MAESITGVGGHGSSIASDPYRFEIAHRRLAFVLRLSVMTNVALVIAVILLVNGIAELAPLKETQIALVRTYGPDDRLYRGEPITEQVEGIVNYLESQAQTYVRLVLEVDKPTQESRHREAMLMTEKRFWKQLRQNRLDTKEMATALKNGLVRRIHVRTASKVEGKSGGYLMSVEFEQIDTRKGVEVGRKDLQAYLTMITRVNEVREADRYINPLGILITDMVVKERS